MVLVSLSPFLCCLVRSDWRGCACGAPTSRARPRDSATASAQPADDYPQRHTSYLFLSRRLVIRRDSTHWSLCSLPESGIRGLLGSSRRFVTFGSSGFHLPLSIIVFLPHWWVSGNLRMYGFIASSWLNSF